jgi:hypothetical protein
MHLLPSLGALSSEAAAGDDDRVGPMGQAIQASRGKQRIAEQLQLLLRGAVAGEQDAAALVPLVDDVVEVLGRRRPGCGDGCANLALWLSFSVNALYS